MVLRIAEDLGLLLWRPRSFFSRSVSLGYAAALVLATSFSVGASAASLVVTPLPGYLRVSASLLAWIVAACFTVASAILWVIHSFVLHASARLLGGRGSVEDTLVVVACSSVGAVAFIALCIAGLALDASVLVVPGAIAALALIIYIQVMGVAEKHELTVARSLVAVTLTIAIEALVLLVLGLA